VTARPVDESDPLAAALKALATGDASIDETLLAQLRPAARAILAQLPGSGLLIVDAQLRVRLVEGPVYDSIGWNSDWLDGRLLPQLMPAAAWQAVERHYELALSGGEAAYDFTAPLDGSLHWTRTVPLRDGDGGVVGAITMSTDATERERVARDDRQRAFLESTPLPTVAVDRGGTIIRANWPMAELLGYDGDELIGRRVSDLAHADDQRRNLEALGAAMAGGETGDRGQARYVRRDGGIVHAEHNLTVVRDAAGEPVEYLVQLVDDTKRRATTEALQQRLGEQAIITLLGERALAGLPLDDLIAEAVTAAVQVLEADMGGYGELSGDQASLTVRRAVGFADGFQGSVFEVSETMRAAIGETVNLDGAMDLTGGQIMGGHGAADSVTVLVGDPRDPLGILAAFAREKREFSDAERNFLRAVAHVLASAIGRARSEERARHEALHDGLTGLPNRALLLDRIDQGLASLAGGGGKLTVVLLDVDGFKLVNDALGHAVGDDLLREVAPRLFEVLGPTDTVARFTGDEFAILCLDPTGDRQADRIAEQVQGGFVRPFLLAGEPHFLSASLGVAVADGTAGRNAEDIVRDADAALNRAKERGRGGYELFDPRTRASVVSRLQTETDLRRAIETDQLRVEYQPYFRLSDGTPAGVEALVRWQHPDRGLISPGEFIPVAEETGLIAGLGEWVLRRACRDLASWRDEHDWATGLRVTVNVSAKQVDQRELTATVESALREAGLAPGLLGIEITEGLLLDESRAPLDALSALKRLGVRLLLDDFGTGYSSLSYLSRFPVDVLKVDRSFVRDLGARADTTPIVTAIVALARGLRLDVIAEGVETEEQLDQLRELGCDYAQGFLLARPMPAEQLVARLAD
jgi:diguanylate cyclase (GGDEF)-like protein/PAS domain S-box-containing protein